MNIFFISIIIGCKRILAANSLLSAGNQRIDNENDILRNIETEIISLTRTTKESLRKDNVERYEKIFLRLAATGAQALGRNMLFASTQTVFQDDDDEENDDGKRGFKSIRRLDDPGWIDDLELEESGRSQFVPQILGEPLYYVPASYWLQVN